MSSKDTNYLEGARYFENDPVRETGLLCVKAVLRHCSYLWVNRYIPYAYASVQHKQRLGCAT